MYTSKSIAFIYINMYTSKPIAFIYINIYRTKSIAFIYINMYTSKPIYQHSFISTCTQAYLYQHTQVNL